MGAGLPPQSFCAPHDSEVHRGPHCPHPEPGADFIGEAAIDLLAQDLEAALPNVGEEFTETVVLDPCPGGACAGAPDYSFTFRVTRLPDVRTDFLSTLGAAVRTSSARSETEAIFAGLRSLKTPHRRKVEQEKGSSPAEGERCAAVRWGHSAASLVRSYAVRQAVR